MIVGALYRRALGGGYPVRRSILNFAYALWGFSLGTFMSLDLVIGIVVAVSLVGGHTGPMHGETMDRGHSGGTWLGDSLIMTARFVLWGIPLAYLLDAWLWLPLWAVATSSAYDTAYGLFHLGATKYPTEDAEWMQGALWELGVILLIVRYTHAF